MTNAYAGGFMRTDTGALVVSGATSRPQLSIAAQGLVAETYPRNLAASNSVAVDGTIYLHAIGVVAGDVITNCHIMVQTIGTAAGSTLAKMGLYDSAGVRLARTADLGAAWETTGLKTHALTAAYTVLTTGAIYVGHVGKNGTTMPQFYRSSTATVPATAVGSGIRAYATGGTTQTDLPDPVTVATGLPISFWVGVS